MELAVSKKFLYFVVLINIFPHVTTVPTWVVLFCFTFLVWKLTSEIRPIPTPGRWLNLAFAAVGSFFVFDHFGTFLGDEAGTPLLLLMACLKLFELKTYRDVMFVSYLCYFLLMSKLISDQSILMTVFLVVDVLLITALLASHHMHGQKFNMRSTLGATLKMTLQAIPLTVLVFLLFPRFNAGLWHRSTQSQGLTGFSDELNPGSISQLIQSDALAFRARIPEETGISSSQLYWRGAILDQSHGLRWKMSKIEDLPDEDRLPSETDLEIEIFLEPQSKPWFFVLDWTESIQVSGGGSRKPIQRVLGRTFRSAFPITNREYYKIRSQTAGSKVAWVYPKKSSYLEVLEEDSPRAKAFAEGLKQRGLSETEIANEIQKFFREEGFTYTLTAPLVKSLDDFMFETKTGYCEHYAGTAATLLRWAGVPSRVVVGFQGGMESLLGDYLSVRYQDAHSWLEYWSEARNTWIRLDPTSVIAPSRLTLGGVRFNDSIDAGGDSAEGKGFASRIFGTDLVRWYFQARMAYDQVEGSWISFLLSYDFNFQKALLEKLGLQFNARLVFFLGLGMALIIFVLILKLGMIRRSQRPAPDLLAYQKLCRKFESFGLPKAPQEGPISYRDRLKARFPDQDQKIHQIFEFILDWRYMDRVPQSKEVHRFLAEIRRMKL